MAKLKGVQLAAVAITFFMPGFIIFCIEILGKNKKFIRLEMLLL
jgi:hypothetical protein